MRFKIDENLPLVAKATILEVGHDCHSVYDEGIDGGSDAELIEACRREGRVLVTLDLDFADIIRYPPTDCAGIVILRLPDQSPPCICSRLQELLGVIARMEMKGHLVIAAPTRIRYR